MSSKKIISLMLAVSLLSSCGWLRDKPKAEKTLETGELDLTCLKVMPSQLQELFAGRYTESAADQASTKAIWTCLDRSLNTFSKYTRGENPGFYTESELQDFANRYLPKESLFNKELVASIFKLKTAVLGGVDTRLTVNEIYKLRAKLNRFGEIILPLAPYISTLLKPYEVVSDSKMQIAADRLNQFVIEFADLLGDSENTVSWANLSGFVTELEKYLKIPNTSLAVVREQIQVFQYLKVLVVGGDEAGIEKTKWAPIFKSISTIYNALYLTNTTTEMMDKLGIDIQSNEAEQINATAKLSSTLLALKARPDIYSKNTVQLMADRWAKGLVLSAALFPKDKSRMAIQSYLGNPKLRKITGFLMDDLDAAKKGDHSVYMIGKIADNLIALIEESSGKQKTPLNLKDLKDLTNRLKPLFLEEDKDFQLIDSAISILQDVSAILIGKDSGNLNAADFHNLIAKSFDLYAAWRTKNPVVFNESLSTSLMILTRAPFAKEITVQQLLSLIDNCEKMLVKLELKNTVDWPLIKKMVLSGAHLKSILFGNTDKSITNYELTQLIETWKVFAQKKEIDEVLEDLATFFRKNPYSSVKIAELMSAVDEFLPENQKLATLGLTKELVGALKAFLAGGSSTVLDRTEYIKIAQVSYTVARSIKPVMKTLPKDFKFGMNSQSVALMEAAVEGLMENKTLRFSNSALKQLLLSQLTMPGMKVQSKTIDRLLIGVNHRIFENNKGPKPSTFPATFDPANLKTVKELLGKIKTDFQDYENAFAGMEMSRPLPGLDLYKRLTLKDTKKVLASLHPIINGATLKPYFVGDKKGYSNYYLFDLYQKDMIYQVLMWIFPYYEIEKDPKRGNFPRLTENDLIDLFDDINDLVYELGLSFSQDTAKATAVKRMQTINLFTSTGNGDPYLDVMETVEFLTMTTGGKVLFEEVRESLVKDCYPQNKAYETQAKFSFACLKKGFFTKNKFTGFYHDVIPQMSEHYSRLNADDLEEFRKATLTTVRGGWNENSSMDLSDLETLISVPYYAENVFLRLDHDHDSVVKFSEAMSGFPIFCREIHKAAGDKITGSCEPGESPRQIEAIYGHLLMRGTAPSTNIVSFLAWVVEWNLMIKDPEYRDSRPPYLYRKDLMNIISNLSASITPAP